MQDVRNKHWPWLSSLTEQLRQMDALCELNVLEQALNACQTTVVRDAWLRGQQVVVHGWVYGLHNGLLKDMNMTVANPAEVDEAYARALEGIKRRYAPS